MNTQFKKNCLMEIYTECDESFLVGFYLSSFDEYSLLHLLDEQGKIDGIYLIKNKFIKNTNYETEYLEKINLYAEFWKINSDKNIFNIGLKQKNISNIGDILKYIKENKIISSFKINKKKYIITGYIKSINKTNIEVQEIDLETAKEFETTSYFLKDNILLIEIDSVNNRLLDYAHLKNH